MGGSNFPFLFTASVKAFNPFNGKISPSAISPSILDRTKGCRDGRPRCRGPFDFTALRRVRFNLCANLRISNSRNAKVAVERCGPKQDANSRNAGFETRNAVKPLPRGLRSMGICLVDAAFNL